jgi:hypothetical protein
LTLTRPVAAHVDGFVTVELEQLFGCGSVAKANGDAQWCSSVLVARHALCSLLF